MIATVPTSKNSKPHAANLNVRMTLELRQELQDVADQHGVDVSVVARAALKRGLRSADRAIANAIERSQQGDDAQLR